MPRDAQAASDTEYIQLKTLPYELTGADLAYLNFLGKVLQYFDDVIRYVGHNKPKPKRNQYGKNYGGQLKNRREYLVEATHFLSAKTGLPLLLRRVLQSSQTYVTGNPRTADGLGSFFLTAFVEHFKRKTRKPNWGEAGAVLAYFRNKPRPSSLNWSSSRVKKFKEANPSWPEEVQSLEELYEAAERSAKSHSVLSAIPS